MTALPARIAEVWASALASGALQPIRTWVETMEDGGVPFQVRVVDSLQGKGLLPTCGACAWLPPRTPRPRSGPRPNPFLPPDPALWVTDVPPNHRVILNKYPVIPHHVLVVTAAFAPQDELPHAGDFAAMEHCFAEMDGLAFYNGGVIGGASQPHKHLQLVPVGFTEFPLAARLHALAAGSPGPVTDPTLPFVHAALSLQNHTLFEAWNLLRATLELCPVPGPGVVQDAPYNLLFTRDWMALLPRIREHAHGISVNALGFAGSLLVGDPHCIRCVKQEGPMRMLAQTGLPRQGPVP